MHAAFARHQLARLMGWTGECLDAEHATLQLLAAHKYDEYEGYTLGARFIERLIRWLAQFAREDRITAYRLLRDRVIFVSRAEMEHLIRSVYPNICAPVIRKATAAQIGLPSYAVRKVEGSVEFRHLLRRSLFLGLSDGARMDTFRRLSPMLDNEQLYPVAEIGEMQFAYMDRQLKKAMVIPGEPRTVQRQFRFLFLLDDFAGTGTTILDQKTDGTWFGYLELVSEWLRRLGNTGAIDPNEVEVHVILYLATDQAASYLRHQLLTFQTRASWRSCHVQVVQPLPAEVVIRPGQDAAIDALLDNYYSTTFEDREVYRIEGGIKYGYMSCGIPVVIHHNSPNNSLFLLWKEGNERVQFDPLFPRSERHH